MRGAAAAALVAALAACFAGDVARDFSRDFVREAAAAEIERIPSVPLGRLERLAALPSRHVLPRPVDVWVPPACEGKRRCGVLYMHDGQHLFDAGMAWNGASWQVVQAVQAMVDAGRIEPVIVVGIHSVPSRRYREYFPDDVLDHLPAADRTRLLEGALGGQPLGRAYLRFLVDELKPLVDARFPTLPGPQDTCTAGASMGGLIAVQAFVRYPAVFGCAAGFSTHWPLVGQPNAELRLAVLSFLRTGLPPVQGPPRRRLYLDHGGRGRDAAYGPFQTAIDPIVRDKGYGDTDYRSIVVPGDGHDEGAWARRLPQALGFLLAPR